VLLAWSSHTSPEQREKPPRDVQGGVVGGG
jgi:hypothetical protein